MKKITATNKKLVKELNAKLKGLQAELVHAHKLEGKDVYIDVKIKKNQANFQKIKQIGEDDKTIGRFYIDIEVTAKQDDVFFPISIASGKKTAGFMYQIEGTAPGSIATADINARGDGVSHVRLGTLLYAKIPAGKRASFQIRIAIRGKLGKRYKIVFARLNYKLNLTETRYQQYLKEIHSDSVSFS